MRFTLLRAFVVAALLANLAYAGWHAGAFRVVGLAPATQREPGRLDQQVRPNGLRVLTPAASASAVASAASAAAVGPLPPPAPAAPVGDAAAAPAAAPSAAASGDGLACLEIGPLEGSTALDNAERALAAVLPPRAWVRESRPAPAQYAVFVGPVLSRDAARLRREELVRLQLSFEAIELPDGRSGGRIGGYAVGRHDSEGAAVAALDGLAQRGLRNAKVVLAREAGAVRPWLRAERLTAAQAAALRALPAAPFGGAAPSECIVGSVMSVGR